jgi:hypothetical protein
MRYENGEPVFENEAEICKTAVQIQDASNIVAVMAEYTAAVKFIRNKHGGDFKYIEHPAIYMFHDKLEDMLRVVGHGDLDKYGKAYKECKQMAGIT